MSSEHISLKFWIKGWYILFKGKLLGKSNNQIVDEQLAQFRRDHPDKRIEAAKADDMFERAKRSED